MLPKIAAGARAYGAEHVAPSSLEEFTLALREGFARKGATLIEVRLDASAAERTSKATTAAYAQVEP